MICTNTPGPRSYYSVVACVFYQSQHIVKKIFVFWSRTSCTCRIYRGISIWEECTAFFFRVEQGSSDT